MNELTHAKMSRQLAINALRQEEKCLEHADGIAYTISKNRIANMYKQIESMDSSISALTEAELFAKDRQAAISRAVQIKQIQMIRSLLADCFAGADNQAGLTSERYTLISNELYRALKELEA